MTFPAPLTLEAARAEASTPWPRPRPLSRPAAPALDLNKCLPPGLAPFRQLCEAVAETLHVPVEAVAPLAIALASIGTARALRIELSPQWVETVNLWVVVLLNSGSKKSAILALLRRPLDEWAKQETAYLSRALAEFDERRLGVTAQLNGNREKQKRATGPDLAKLKADALDLRATLENMPDLKAPVLIADDITPEAMRNDLARNGEKLAFVTAESDAEQLLGKRYGNGAPNLNLLIKTKGGDNFSSSRASGQQISLDGPLTIMALIIQYTAIEEIVRDVYAQGRGHVPRFWFIAPHNPPGHPDREIDADFLHPEPVPPALLIWWGKTFRRLLDLPWPGRVVLTPDGPARYEKEPHTVRLSPEAWERFDEIRKDLVLRQREGNDLHSITAFAEKFPAEIVRLAAVMEAMQDPAAELITGETMRAACEWAPFIIGHYLAVMCTAAEPAEMKLARRLLDKAKRKSFTEITAKEALDLLHGSSVKKMDDIRPALDLLVEIDWLRELPPPPPRPGRPPSPCYAINPAAIA